MIIKIIPETDAESAKHREIELKGVKEFFVFGNRKDEDGYLVDFHEWEGNYKYLIGSLQYFYELINDERRDNAVAKAQKPIKPPKIASAPKLVKHGEPNKMNVIDISNFRGSPYIKPVPMDESRIQGQVIEEDHDEEEQEQAGQAEQAEPAEQEVRKWGDTGRQRSDITKLTPEVVDNMMKDIVRKQNDVDVTPEEGV